MPSDAHVEDPVVWTSLSGVLSVRARWRLRLKGPLLGGLAGMVLYLEVLVASLATGGTTSWAYPDEACATSRVMKKGVAAFPDCPQAAGTRWAQRAVNWPSRALRSYLPSLNHGPQELRLPPHGEGKKRRRWRAWSWLLVGATGYAIVGALATSVGAVVWALARRRLGGAGTTNALSGDDGGPPTRGRTHRIIRSFVTAAAAATIALPFVWVVARGPADSVGDVAYELPKLRALTRGPTQHFFGYYDKLQFDPTDRYVLGMATRTENRLVESTDSVEIGMVDLDARGQSWIRLGESRAWNWQQGCMLQWLPGARREIIWNDREGEGEDAHFVSRVLDVGTRTLRTIGSPIYAVAPNGESALSIDFSRLQRARPTYGYVGVDDPSEGELAPTDNGVFEVDLESGESRLILSIADVVGFGRSSSYAPHEEHYLEMVQFNPSGTRFVVFERWIAGALRSRVFTANSDGSELFLLSSGPGNLSHVAWLDDANLTIFATAYDGYAMFEDRRGYTSTLLEASRDGHEWFIAGGEWMLSDTYGDDHDIQHPFLYHIPTETTFALAHLMAEDTFEGKLRCDNHPRVSRDGRKIVIDSAHRQGRQMYLLDIGDILDAYSVDGGAERR